MKRSRQRNEATAQIGVLVGESTKRTLDERAASEGLSLSHYCARVLTAHLETEAAA